MSIIYTRGVIYNDFLRRGSLTILNPLRDVTLSVRGEVIDNVGQRFPRYMPNRIDDMNVSWGEVIDIVG